MTQLIIKTEDSMVSKWAEQAAQILLRHDYKTSYKAVALEVYQEEQFFGTLKLPNDGVITKPILNFFKDVGFNVGRNATIAASGDHLFIVATAASDDQYDREVQNRSNSALTAVSATLHEFIQGTTKQAWRKELLPEEFFTRRRELDRQCRAVFQSRIDQHLKRTPIADLAHRKDGEALACMEAICYFKRSERRCFLTPEFS